MGITTQLPAIRLDAGWIFRHITRSKVANNSPACAQIHINIRRFMKPSWRSCKLNAFIRAAMTIQPPLINRDLSILAFNERVLDWAAREEVP